MKIQVTRYVLICVWIYLCLPSSISGLSLSLSGSSSYAVLNQQFTFTCTVTQAADLDDLIGFFKKSLSDSKPFVILTQKRSACLVYREPSKGYTASCGSGTSSNSSSTKNYTLTINSVIDRDTTYSDATDWWCVLNTAGRSSTRFSLHVYKDPDSIRFSATSPRTIIEGQTLSVRCSADCIPSPCSFSWTQENKNISSNSQLTQKNIRREQTRFTCTATNTFTSTSKSRDFQLTVYYGPDNVHLNTSALTIQEGDDVAVSCESDCVPGCTFTWTFTNQISNSSLLSLRNIQRSQDGVYTCTATNSKNAGKSAVNSLSIDVQYEATIRSVKLNSQSTKITVDELTPMTLSCDVDSNPASDIKLLNNSQTVYEVKNSKIAVYKWKHAGCLDTGYYTCEAGNNVKSVVDKRVQLVVRCSPRLDHRDSFQDSFVSAVGDDVTLQIYVIANPLPTLTWYIIKNGSRKKLGSSIPATTSASTCVGMHVIRSVHREDFAIYQVVVSNGDSGGDLVENITLTSGASPEAPTDVTGRSIGSTEILVSWKEKYSGGLEQTFTVEYREKSINEWTQYERTFQQFGQNKYHTIIISGLRPETSYLIRITAENQHGKSVISDVVNVFTQEKQTSGFATGFGSGVAASLGVVMLVGAAICLFRRIRHPGLQSTTNKHSGDQHEHVIPQGIQETSVGEHETDNTGEQTVTNVYDPLEHRSETQYEELGVYENPQRL